MVIVIEKGEVFTPAAIGSADLLLVRDCVEKVGAVDREALARLEFETEFVDATDCFEDSNRSIQLVGKEAQD